MTIKSLLNFGGFDAAFHKGPSEPPIVDRYHHSGGHGEWHGGWHGSKKGSGGNHGAALSALSLLAFLFLLNVMQQSLMENNATETSTATTIFLREEKQQPIPLKSRNDETAIIRDSAEITVTTNEPKNERTFVKIESPVV